MFRYVQDKHKKLLQFLPGKRSSLLFKLLFINLKCIDFVIYTGIFGFCLFYF